MSSFKKIIWLGVLAFLHTASFSQTKKDSSQYESLKIKELEQTIPTPIGWVNDFADILNYDEIKNLDSIIANYEKKTTVEI